MPFLEHYCKNICIKLTAKHIINNRSVTNSHFQIHNFLSKFTVIKTPKIIVYPTSNRFIMTPHQECTDAPNEPELGDHQSPIDLNDKDIIKCETDEFDISCTDLEKEHSGSIANNGHTVTFKFPCKCKPIIKGGGLPSDEYKIENIHFHWDSEHTINQQRFPMECHIVTYAAEYDNIEEALNDYGVSVLAILYEYADKPNAGLQKIVNVIPQISKFKSESHALPLHSIILGDFLPVNIHCFYRYIGSLTTHPYSEGVVWTVFKNTLPVTRKQLADLSNIYGHDGRLVVNNFRKTFPLNTRSLFYVCDDNFRRKQTECLCKDSHKQFPNPIRAKGT